MDGHSNMDKNTLKYLCKHKRNADRAKNTFVSFWGKNIFLAFNV